MYRRCFGLMAMMGLLAIVGCGSDDGFGERYAVTGKVTYKGAPLEKAKISFYPVTADPKGINSGSFGNIVNGTYTLSTRGDNDGAFPGEYLVSIVARDVDLSSAEANVKGGVTKQDDVSKAYKTAKSLIPKKYEVAETSGLKATVKSSSNTIDFELTD